MESTPGFATLRSLDGLLHALELERVDADTYVAVNELARFPRVFGGLLAAQAMQAATLTVDRADGLRPHSIHATYLRSGSNEEPIRYAIDRVRDGRATSTRQVTATQGNRAVLIAIVSFHNNPGRPVLNSAGPLSPGLDMPGPDKLPTLADWANAAPPPLRETARRMWVDLAPPLDVRIGEAFTFLGGSQASGARSHWFRLPRHVGDDHALHSVLLTYASDYFLLDMAVRTHPARLAGARRTRRPWTIRSGCIARCVSISGTSTRRTPSPSSVSGASWAERSTMRTGRWSRRPCSK